MAAPVLRARFNMGPFCRPPGKMRLGAALLGNASLSGQHSRAAAVLAGRRGLHARGHGVFPSVALQRKGVSRIWHPWTGAQACHVTAMPTRDESVAALWQVPTCRACNATQMQCKSKSASSCALLQTADPGIRAGKGPAGDAAERAAVRRRASVARHAARRCALVSTYGWQAMHFSSASGTALPALQCHTCTHGRAGYLLSSSVSAVI